MGGRNGLGQVWLQADFREVFCIQSKVIERWILLVEELGCKLYRSSLNGCHLGTELFPAVRKHHFSGTPLTQAPGGSVGASHCPPARATSSCLRIRDTENRKCAETALSCALAPHEVLSAASELPQSAVRHGLRPSG